MPFVASVDLREYLSSDSFHNKLHLSALYSIVLANSDNQLLCADVSTVDYNEGRGETTTDPKVLRPVYCDDAMLAFLVSGNTFVKSGVTTMCGDVTKTVHAWLKEFVDAEENFDPDVAYPGKVKAIRSGVFKELKGGVAETILWPKAQKRGEPVVVEHIDRGNVTYHSLTESTLYKYIKDDPLLTKYKQIHKDWIHYYQDLVFSVDIEPGHQVSGTIQG